jgi:hypothetical protein
MVIVAQLVRAPDCGSGGRRFEPGLSPVNVKELVFPAPFFLALQTQCKKGGCRPRWEDSLALLFN